MSPVHKNPPSTPPSDRPLRAYVENEDERSAIRKKVRENTPPRGISRAHAPRPLVSKTATSRLELKLNFARLVLQDLSPATERARLLAAAIIRRDETQLDELLRIGSPPVLDDGA